MTYLVEHWQLGIIIFALIYSAWIFFHTMITKKFRNKAKDEAHSWVLGIFYYNPHDARLFLPKRTGLGMTLIFANPLAKVIVSILIAIIVLHLAQ